MALFTNIDSQNGQPKYLKVGQVIAVAVSGTMTGYVDGASLTISAPAAGGVQAVATITVVSGAITKVVFTNFGAGYTSAPTITAPNGSGAVLVAKVAAVNVPNSEIVFVSYEESQFYDNQIKGITTPGWNRVTEKLKSDGQVTYKVETLVAMNILNAISGDGRGDNLIAGNVEISITSQPANLTVTAPDSATFSVAGSGITTFQWQIQVGGSGTYNNLLSTGVYSGGVTSSTLTINDSTGLTGNRYRVVCGDGGDAQVTSRGATLTVNPAPIV